MRARTMALIAAVALPGAAAANPTSNDPAKVPAGTYALDKRHASLVVKVPHMGGFSRYQLRFTGLDGGFAYDPASWRTTKLTISVDPKSVDTEEASFDKEIVGWLEPAKYPSILFTVTGIEAVDGKGTLAGDLSLHGVTKPVTLDVTFNGAGPGLLGAGTRMGFSGTGRVKRSDFGIDEAKLFAGDDVDLMFEVEFVKK